MDYIPNSAIMMGIGLLIVIWGFLVHMMMSQGPDAHLQFAVELMRDVEERSGSSPPHGLSPSLPAVNGMRTLHQEAPSPDDESQQRSLHPSRLEVPLLFATSLRGRGL
jgi:hypothetical protein